MKPIEVLVVDDNSGDVLLICQALTEQLFPVRVHVALDGAQALQLLENGQVAPDLVILDLNLPKVSGLSFLLRCQLQNPIVVFSSSNSPDDLRRALELGAKDFVQKPSDFGTYKQRISEMVRNWVHPAARLAASPE